MLGNAVRRKKLQRICETKVVVLNPAPVGGRLSILKGVAMQTFQGNLLIGGMALNNVEGMLCDDGSGMPSHWSGQLRIDPCQHEVLEIDRQYLLMLDDGRNREVVLTDIQVESEEEPVVCVFEDWPSIRRPK